MKTLIASLGIALALGSSVALAQEAPPAAPPPPAFEAPPAPPAAPPSADGEWVPSAEYGWIWVPASADTVLVQNQPYTYFYTPTYGWTWYVSPWGIGRYHQGPWIHHAAYAPRVWHTNVWVAPRPRVVMRPRYAPPARVVVHAPAAHVVFHGGPVHHR